MRQMIRCGKRAPSAAEIDDSMPGDRQARLRPAQTFARINHGGVIMEHKEKAYVLSLKSKRVSLHIWQAAMRARVGVDRQREAEQAEGKKNTGGNHSWQCAGSCCFIFVCLFIYFQTL